MQSDSSGKELILAGIAEDGVRQTAALIAEAETIAKERIVFARQKAETIRKETGQKAEVQSEAIRQSILSGIAVELKRKKMAVQDSLLKDVLSRVRASLSAAIGTPGYREILIGWIVEAAIGLDSDAARVNASPAELPHIDTAMLQEATDRSTAHRHRPVTLSLSTEAPLDGQGVIVTASDGRTAFNNQVETRIRRIDSRIRSLVYDRLFPASLEHNTSTSDKQVDKS